MRVLTAEGSEDGFDRRIIGAGIDVHRELGPGLVGVHERGTQLFELSERGFSVDPSTGPIV
jgi:hypothetical protein